MVSKKPVFYALTGCTACGKTEWALRWAEANDAEIISCDSQLFYRGMDIGTAKPTAAELQRVRHHLVDVCEVDQQMNIARFVEQARAALGEITSRGKAALVVGGSGFYLKAFFAGVIDEVTITPALRSEVAALALEEMLQRLRMLNPGGLGGLDVANPRRVSRALERCLSSGRTLLEMADAFARQPTPFDDCEIRLTRIDREPAELEQRIVERVASMLRDGLVEEVRVLLGRGLKENVSAARAIGYRETIEFIEGRLPEAQLPLEIVKNTRGLVKKQRTWFRTQLPPHRVVWAREIKEARELFE